MFEQMRPPDNYVGIATTFWQILSLVLSPVSSNDKVVTLAREHSNNAQEYRAISSASNLYTPR